MTRSSHEKTESRQEPSPDKHLIDAARAQVSSQSTQNLTSTVVRLSSLPKSRPLPPPETFRGYQIVKEIHGGGQGVVYQAIQESTKQKVALKVIHEGAFADPRNRARLQRGVRILAELNHPNIVSVIDSGDAAGSLFYVMDYIPGQSLDEWLDSRRRSSQQESPSRYRLRWRRSSSGIGSARTRRRQLGDIEVIVRLFIKICDATNAAHMNGVIHRDLKPGNIRIDDRNEPHLLDFDLAKIIGGDILNSDPVFARTITGEFLGTLRWASPEQIERTPSKIDVRTDVYSLGVILYEALTGLTPYPMLGTRREIEDHILNTDPIPPSRHRSSLDEDLDAIVLKCLSKQRERRYHSAGPIADDLRSFLAQAPISARRDSTWYLVRKLSKRHKLAVVTLTCMIATLVGATLTSLYFFGEERKAKEEQEVVAEQRHSDLVRETKRSVAAQSAIAQATLGWFMLTWHLDQEQVAKAIRDQTPPGTAEHMAMQFLLDSTEEPEHFLAQLPANATSMGYYVAGERALKLHQTEAARKAFSACLKNGSSGWYHAPAEARLAQLKADDTN